MSRDFTHATLAAHTPWNTHTEPGELQSTTIKVVKIVKFCLEEDSVCAPCVTFVLADLLDPGERVDFHQGVGNADDVHHVHHTLMETPRREIKREGRLRESSQRLKYK